MRKEDIPEDEYDDDEMGEDGGLSEIRINAIELAIKAVSVSGSTKDPEQILKIAQDYYKFIISDDEE